MNLKTDHYTFYAKHEITADGDHWYYIGNADNKPKACVTITVSKILKDLIMTIQEVEYFSSCSLQRLERSAGTIEMLQGAIRAVLKKHPTISMIELNDKSFFTLPSKKKDLIALPEYRILTKGKTWYEEYFGAVPGNARFKHTVEKYKELWASNKVSIPDPLTESAFKKMIVELRLPGIVSGNGWVIPLGVVLDYKYDGKFKRGRMVGGDGWSSRGSGMTYFFRLYNF
jgi:hypothetical protein